jgi:hypothetical protein
MGSDYKSENAEMRLFAEEMAKSGKPAVAGERLDHLIVKDRHGRTKKGHKMRLLSMFRENVDNGMPEPVDVHYYLTNVLRGTVDTLFNVGYRRDLDALEEEYTRAEEARFWTKYTTFLQKCCRARDGKYADVVSDALRQNTDAQEVIDFLRFSAPGRSVFDKIAKKTLSNKVIDARLRKNPLNTLSKLARQKAKVCEQIRAHGVGYTMEQDDVEYVDIVVEEGESI